MGGLIEEIREQVMFLQELGVDALGVRWAESGLPEEAVVTLRKDPAAEPSAMGENIAQRFERAAPPENLEIPKREIAEQSRTGSRLSALPSLKERKTAAPRKPDRKKVLEQFRPAEVVREAEPEMEAVQKLEETIDTIESIRAEIGDCTRCPLHEGRTKVVHTTGNFQADLMFVGEAPGADEDAQGFPFVGRAGQLLTKIIEGMGYKREEVVIGNINRCRPPANRQPTLPEAHTCRPFLLREIAVIKPKVIVVMGNTALHNLLDTKMGITKVRGEFQDYFGVKVMPTFHPAFLLRDPRKKREVWEDMKKVRDHLANSASEPNS